MHVESPGSLANPQDLSWQWSAAIQALEEILIVQAPVTAGYLFMGPAPVLQHPQLTAYIFSPFAPTQTCLPPGFTTGLAEPPRLIPLNPADPLAQSLFCLFAGTDWQLLLSFVPETGLHFSFDPVDITQAWEQLQHRIARSAPALMANLGSWWLAHPPVAPDFRLVTQFSQILLRFSGPSPLLPTTPRTFPAAQAPVGHQHTPREESRLLDVELLLALTHEVRTPLATIQTLTQLLLKRSDLPPEVYPRLHTIVQECHEQVDRFSLLFHAAELMTTPPDAPSLALTPVSVDEVLRDNLPRWQKQAQRRHLMLKMDCPKALPAVISDPNLLDQVLTGLVEHFSQTLPPMSTLTMHFSLAGSQLKVQLRSSERHRSQTLASLGKLLLWQPETGHLSLNLTVTKTLFHALGGKLTVRQDHRWGDILTLYLPLNPETPVAPTPPN